MQIILKEGVIMPFDNSLKISYQLCHPIYSAANALTRLYKPILKPLGITYPQYLILMVLWENDGINLNAISDSTYFDSGTLTPLIQKLKQKSLIRIEIDQNDRRNKIVFLTIKGQRLKEAALEVPKKLQCLLPFSKVESQNLIKMIRLLHQALLNEEKTTTG